MYVLSAFLSKQVTAVLGFTYPATYKAETNRTCIHLSLGCQLDNKKSRIALRKIRWSIVCTNHTFYKPLTPLLKFCSQKQMVVIFIFLYKQVVSGYM